MNNLDDVSSSTTVNSESQVEDLVKSTSDNIVGTNDLNITPKLDSIKIPAANTTSCDENAEKKLKSNNYDSDTNKKNDEIDGLIKTNKRNQNCDASFDSQEPYSKRICSGINLEFDLLSNSESPIKDVHNKAATEKSLIENDLTQSNNVNDKSTAASDSLQLTETETEIKCNHTENDKNKSDNTDIQKESLNPVSEMCITPKLISIPDTLVKSSPIQKNETNTMGVNLKIQLDPLPENLNEQKITTSVSKDFLKSFKKSFNLMSRSNLEEFVLQKIVETIVNKSQLSELRQKNETLEQTIIKQRQRINDLAKQFRDLEMVHNRVIKDLENKSNGLVTPVKITRAVGLQVSQPRSKTDFRSISAQPNQRVPPFPSRSPQRYINSNVTQIAQRINGSNQLNSQNNSHSDLVQTKAPFGQQAKMIVQKQQAIQRHQSLIQQQRSQNLINQRQSPGSTQNGRSPITLSSPGSQRNASVLNQIIGNPHVRQVNSPVVVRKIIRPTLHEETNINKLIDLTDEEDSEQKTHNTTKTKIHVKSPATLNSSIVGTNQTHDLVRSGLVLNSNTSTKVPIQRISSNHFLQITPKVGSMSQTQVVRQQIIKATNQKRNHPAPLPMIVNKKQNTTWKRPPPRPQIRINNIDAGIVISWTIHEQRLVEDFDSIVKYQIYAYQETDQEPSTEYWRHVGDVKAMALPMAVTLTEFQEGQKYHFAVRAVDVHDRLGPFSAHRTWDEKP